MRLESLLSVFDRSWSESIALDFFLFKVLSILKSTFYRFFVFRLALIALNLELTVAVGTEPRSRRADPRSITGSTY